MSEPFDTWRNTSEGIGRRQMAVSQIRHTYNAGFEDGIAAERRRIQPILDRIERNMELEISSMCPICEGVRTRHMSWCEYVKLKEANNENG